MIKKFDTGTPFQQKVWRAIQKIPKGETRSYAWLARAIGKPKAARAVANACGANPFPIIIPCHRVIRSDGTIGGFSSGVENKKRLLQKEGIEKRLHKKSYMRKVVTFFHPPRETGVGGRAPSRE